MTLPVPSRAVTDLVVHLNENTLRIVELLQRHDLDRPVPTCGEWTLADLTWHLAEVQMFWAWVVEHGDLLPDAYTEPSRPADPELPAVLAEARERLVHLLRTTDPAAPAWSWADDQTVGFTRRRQAHEALIHRVDAELAVGEPSPVDRQLAADGVDEVLSVFVGGTPWWATFTPGEATLAITATDAGATWKGRFGRMIGTSPQSGRAIDGLGFELVAEGRARTELRGPAADLDLWLWGRGPDERLEVRGDATDAALLRDLMAQVSQ